MEMRKIMHGRNKRGWIRVMEAFIAIIIIFGVLLLLFSRNRAVGNTGEEITKLQINILDSLSRDNVVRNQVLSNDSREVNRKVGLLIPNWLNYTVSICEPDLACSINISYISQETLRDREVYSAETLILSNETYFNDKKLKLFFWKI